MYEFTLDELEKSSKFKSLPLEDRSGIARLYVEKKGPDEAIAKFQKIASDPEFSALPEPDRDSFKQSFSQFYGIELPLDDVSFGTDVKDVVMSGLAGTSAIPKAAATVAGWLGFDDSKETLLDIAKTTENFYNAKISKQGRQVQQQDFLSDQDGKWFGDNAIKKVFMVSAESLPLMIATAPIGGAASAAVSRASFLPNFIRALEGGSKSGQWSHNLLTFGASEAGTSALVSAADAGEKVATMDEKVLAKSPVYRALIEQGMDPTTARAELRGIVEEETFKTQAAATLAGSAVSPGGAMSKLFQKGAAKKGVAREFAEGMGSEALQEAPQSGLEQLGENITTRRNLDPTQSLTENVGEATALGAASGGLTGGAMGGGAKILTIKDAQTVAGNTPLNADPEAIAAQIEAATGDTAAAPAINIPGLDLANLSQEDIEDLAALQQRIGRSDLSQLQQLSAAVPTLRERRPNIAPQIEQLIGNRIDKLSGQAEQDMQQQMPAFDRMAEQVAQDDLMDDWAETEADLQQQTDARGRRQGFERLRENLAARTLNQESLAANMTGRPSTAEEAAAEFDEAGPTETMAEVEQRLARRADAEAAFTEQETTPPTTAPSSVVENQGGPPLPASGSRSDSAPSASSSGATIPSLPDESAPQGAASTSTQQVSTAGAGEQGTAPLADQALPDVETIEHVTKKGKTIKGIVVTGKTKDEVKAIDPFTFAKDGGFFVRDKHLEAVPKDWISPAQPTTDQEAPSLDGIAGQIETEKKKLFAIRKAIKGQSLPARVEQLRAKEAEVESNLRKLREQTGEEKTAPTAPATLREETDRDYRFDVGDEKDAIVIEKSDLDLDDDQRAVERKFANQIASNLDKAIAAYNDIPDTEGGRILNVDEARVLSRDYAASKENHSKYAKSTHEPASFLIKEIMARKLAQDFNPDIDVLFMSGGGGVGKTSATRGASAELKELYDTAEFILDGTFAGEKSARDKIKQVLATGRTVSIVHTARDPFESFADGSLPRAERSGRTVPMDVSIADHKKAGDVFLKLQKEFAGDDRVNFLVVDNTKGLGKSSEGTLDLIKNMNYDEIMRRADEELERQFKAGIISRRVYEGTKSRTPYQGARLGGGKTQPREDDGLSHQEPERGSGSRRGPPEGRAAGEESPAVTPATPEPPSSVRSTPSTTTEEVKPKPADRPSGETVPAPVQAEASQSDKFATNKIFTSSAIEAAKARLAAKRNTLRSGFDPELLQDLLVVGGGHFEAGVRKFGDWARAVIADIGREFAPFLRGTYENLRYYPGLDTKGMSTGQEVDRDLTEVLLEDIVKETGQETKGGDNVDLATRDAAAANRDDRDGNEGNVAAGVPPYQGSGEDASGVSETDGTGPDGGVRPGDRPNDTGSAQEEPAAAGDATADRDGNKSDLGDGAGKSPRVSRKPVPAGRDYRIPAGGIKREGSWKETARRNLDIIELAKKLESEKRPATSKEQELLAKYTGFGATEIANNLFPGYAQYGEIRPSWARDDGWKELAQRLTEILTPEEIKTAARSTQYAHYTSEAIINSIYKGLARFGFKGGKVLEPGAGSSSFWGLMPQAMHGNSRYTGIEMDHVTALIAKHLYPEQAILRADFTQHKLPGNFFDLAIGNPPFGDITITADPEYKRHKFLLHDYFFAKSVDKVRPGGLLVFITSKGTMDKAGDKARRYLGERADLLGAIRLPQTAFKQQSGTEVVTDVLFFKKREPGQEPAGSSWQGLDEVKTPEGPTLVNEYFADHPEMVLGTHSLKGSMYGKDQYTVMPLDGDIEEHFAKAIENLPKDVYTPEQQKKKDAAKKKAEETIEFDFNPDNKKEGGIYLDAKGQLMRTTSGAGKTVTTADGLTENQIAWLKDYVLLRNAVKKAQHDQLNDGDWETSLAALNKAYDKFTKKHGPILENTITERKEVDEDGEEKISISKRYKNKKVMWFDAEAPLVLALEKEDEAGVPHKGPFLKGRSIQKPQRKQPTTIADALALSLDNLGELDIADIALSMGITEAEAIDGLGTLIFKNPDNGKWEPRDAYLSGDVRAKLQVAQSAAAADEQYRRNVEALEAVQPSPLKAADVTIKLGATWIEPKVVDQFADEVLGTRVSVTYNEASNTFTVTPTGRATTQSGRTADSEWATPRRSAIELLDAVLNNRTIKVVDKDESGKSSVNATATVAANEVAAKMRSRFSSWIWEDAERAGKHLDLYNQKFNNLAGRSFDGSHLTLPGVSLRFKLHAHQKNVIWRIIQTGNTYIGHGVGAGKTMVMISAGMEMKRLGLVQKPIYVVPKHMLSQFSNEFMAMYPMAHIMVADEERFHTNNRREFIAQAALNSPDAIIVTHPSLVKLGMRKENVDVVANDMIQELRESLSEMQDAGESRFLIKRVEKSIERLEQMFAGMVSQDKDQALTFEELGADFMFVDEAHEFRKMDFATNRQAKGIDSSGSKRSIDLFIKTKWLGSQNPGRSHAFASGTPITNTMGELYNLMKFFIEPEMQKDGIAHFDAWASMFGEVAPDFERDAAGRPQIVERFANFVNVPELMKRVRSFMDVMTFSDLGAFVKRPGIRGGQPQMVLSPQSKELTAYLRGPLTNRLKASANWKPSKEQPGNPDPVINIITDGRLASIDMRFIDPSLPSNPDSKLNKMIDGVIETWRATKDNTYTVHRSDVMSKTKGGAQIVFYNNGFGEGVKGRGFDARAWMSKRLKDAGIPASEIGWIDDADNSVKKARLFMEMRSGTKRILIGSAKKMGTGINVQHRLHTLHYMDAPWFPADVEQPMGRIIRQGNQHSEVDVKWYATEGSYDSTMWQMVTRKARFIEQAFSGDDSARRLEDVSAASQYAMATAISSGDVRVMQLASLKNEIERLTLLQRAHAESQRSMRGSRATAEWNLDATRKRLKELTEAAAKVGPYVREVSGVVDGTTYTNRAELGAAIQAKAEAIIEETGEVKGDRVVVKELGKINDYPLTISIGRNGPTMQLVVTKNVKVGIVAEGDPGGLVTRIVNQLNSVATNKRDAERKIDEYQDEIKRYDKKIGAPFEYSGELNAKTAEAQQLQSELVAEGQDTDAPQPPQSDELLVSIAQGVAEEEAANDVPTMNIQAYDGNGNKSKQNVEATIFTVDLGGKRFTFGLHEVWKKPGEFAISEYYSGLMVTDNVSKSDRKKPQKAVEKMIAERGLSAEQLESVIRAGIGRDGQVNGTEGEISFSVDSPKLSVDEVGDTAADIRAEITAKLGREATDALFDSGAVEMISPEEAERIAGGTVHSLDGQIQGITTGTGKVYLVDGGIKASKAWSVLLHEFGTHAGRLMTSSSEWRQLEKTVERRRASSGEFGKLLREAYARIPKDTPAENVTEEAIAYLVENHPDVGIVRRVMALIKRALVKIGLSPDIFSAADLRALADIAVRRKANEALAGASREMAEGDARPVMMSQQQADIFKPVNTTSANFKKWFGDSVVTENGKAGGKPLAVYHGTRADFDAFKVDKKRGGIFFHADPGWARQYGKTIYKLYIKAENPLDYENPTHLAKILTALRSEKGYQGWWEEEATNGDWEMIEKRAVQEMLRSSGHDSFWVNDRPGKAIAVISPTQVKSAISSTGDFSKTDPRIRFSIAPAPPPATATRPDLLDRLAAKNPTLADAWERFVYGIIDKDDPRRRVMNRATQVTAATDILTVERLRSKKTADEVEQFMEKEVKPLLKHLATNKLETKDLEEYAYAMHVPERNLRMRQVNAKGYIDAVAKHLNAEEGRALDDEMIDIRSDILMSGGTRAERQDKYLDVLGRLMGSTDQMRANLAVEQDALDNRQFTPAEVAKNTQATLQKRLDQRAEHISEIVKLRDRWDRESVRYAGITDAEAQSIVDKWRRDPRYAAVQTAKDQLEAINQKKLDLLYESGQLSEAEYTSLTDGYQHYVPLHRDLEEDNRPATGRITGPTGHPLKVAKGSMLEVVNILAHSVRNTQAAIVRKHKAEAGRILYNFAKENPDAGIEVGKQKKNPTHDKEGNVVLYESPMEGQNELYVRVDGERYTLTFDAKNATTKRFLESIKEADVSLKGPMKLVAGATRFLASVNTTLSPEFVISNFSRDIQTALAHLEDSSGKGLQGKVLRNTFPAIRGIFRAEFGNENTYWGRVYRDFAKNGGKIGWMQSYDTIKDLAKDLESTMHLYQKGHVPKKAFHAIGNAIAKTNLAIENGVRLATYDQLVKAGVSPAKAALEAANLTVDFTRRGSYSPTVNALYMFFNAGVQGNVRMLKAMHRSGKVKVLVGGIIAAGFGLQMLGYAVGGDDDSDQPYIDGIPDHITERNMVIMKPGGKGEYIKIPMPYGYNTFYVMGSEIGKAFNAWMAGKKYEAGKGGMRVGSTFMSSFNPLQSATMIQTIAPTVADPFVMIGENKDAFGRDLIPSDNPYGVDKANAFRHFKSVSTPAKHIAQALHRLTGGKGEYDDKATVDVSPEWLDLMYDTATGSAGRFIKDTLMFPIDMATKDPGEKTDANKVPFVRRVYGEWSDRSIADRYYKKAEEVDRIEKNFKAAPTKEERIEVSKEPLFKAVGPFNQADKTLKKLREARDKAEAAGKPTTVIDQKIVRVQAEILRRSSQWEN